MLRARNALVIVVASVAFWPARAGADGYVTPWIGVNAVSASDEGRTAFGVTTGYMGGGVFGFEADVGYSPEFFGSIGPFGNTSAVSVMGDFILGIPIGGTHGAGVRPFVTGGVGVVRTHADRGDVIEVSRSTNEFAYDLGVGMMGFFNQHVGLRGDARYIRSLRDTNFGSGVDFEPARPRYWRASVGVAFR